MVVKVNVNAWKTKSEKAKARIKVGATAYVQRKALEVLKEALKVSPQWSGDYASHWDLIVGAPIVNTVQVSKGYGHFKVQPWYMLPRSEAKKAGDPDAINWALKDAIQDIKEAKWNSKIALVNNSPTAEIVESPGFVPRKDGGNPSVPVIAHLKMKFNYLNKT